MTETFEQVPQSPHESQTNAEIMVEERVVVEGIVKEADAAGLPESSSMAHLTLILTEAAQYSLDPQERADLPLPEEIARRRADLEQRFGKAA